jgi:hypothetical protein|eukprot:4354935-Prymnesium_polylepis.3
MIRIVIRMLADVRYICFCRTRAETGVSRFIFHAPTTVYTMYHVLCILHAYRTATSPRLPYMRLPRRTQPHGTLRHTPSLVESLEDVRRFSKLAMRVFRDCDDFRMLIIEPRRKPVDLDSVAPKRLASRARLT